MPANSVLWPTPLTRLNPWYPGQFGVPGTDSETGLRLNTDGCIFWVDPNHVDANDNRDGTNPTAPLATVAAALTHCQAYRGDVIAVMHNGYWTYGDTTQSNVTPIQENVTVNVPGVRIVGVCPSGSLGVPWIPSGDNQTLITVNQLDVTIEGFCFWEPGAYSGTTAIFAQWDSPSYYGENLTVRHCYFYSGDYGIVLDWTYNCYIEECSFCALGAQAIHNTSVQGDPDYVVIRDNLFTACVGAVNLPTTTNALLDNNRFLTCLTAIDMVSSDYCTIVHNTIQGDGTGTNNFIDLTGGSDNLVCDNCLACTIAQYDTTCSDGTSGSWGGNHCANGDTTAAPT